ncbi:MAG: DHH family phosphoesterase [Porphyromonas sp.]|nr:DHH family phosphoesterase [Porphyromonas sp.]
MRPDFIAEDLHILQQQLSQPKRVVLLGHVSPDGDAVGSTLAFARILEQQGHQVTVIYPTPFSQTLAFLPGADRTIIGKDELERAEEEIAKSEVILCMDFNEAYRVQVLLTSLEASSAFKVMIDHHPYPADFTDLSFSYPALSSTCLLTYHLVQALGWDHYIDKGVATCIYVGMMTDTGFLTYNSDDPSIYLTISALLEKGIEKDAVTSEITRNFSFNKIKLNAYLLSNKMEFYPEYKASIITMSMAEKRKYDYQIGDVEGLVNEPLTSKEIELSIFLHEMPRITKVSLRSKGDFSVNKFASQFFNGGGHCNAAGAELYMSLEEAVKLVRQAVEIMHP